MTHHLDPLLEQIDLTLAECDASTLLPIIKLTRDQLDSIPATPAPPPWANGSLGDFAGTPIQVVDTVEESSPHQLRHGPVHHVTDDGPRAEPPPIAMPMPPSWWRRILRRSR